MLLTFLLKCHVKSLKRSQFDWHSWRILFKSVLKTLHIQMHHDLSLINQWSKAENVHLKFLHKQSSQVCRISLLNACKRSEKLNERILFHASFLSCMCSDGVSLHICCFTHLLLSTSVCFIQTPLCVCVCVCVCVCSWHKSVESHLICFAIFHMKCQYCMSSSDQYVYGVHEYTTSTRFIIRSYYYLSFISQMSNNIAGSNTWTLNFFPPTRSNFNILNKQINY